MATLKQHRSGAWRIRFWFGGKQYFRSLDTDVRKTADQTLASVEELLGHLNTGRLTVPPDVDNVGAWIVSGGKVAVKPKVKEVHPLKDVIDDYFASIPEGAKSENSLLTERIHLNHFKDILKGSTPIDSIGVAGLQDYVVKRSKDAGIRGRNVQPETIRKEMVTFGTLRRFAKREAGATARSTGSRFGGRRRKRSHRSECGRKSRRKSKRAG